MSPPVAHCGAPNQAKSPFFLYPAGVVSPSPRPWVDLLRNLPRHCRPVLPRRPQAAGSMATRQASDSPARAWAASLGSCGPPSPRYVSAAELTGWTEFRLAFASRPVAAWLAPLLPTTAVGLRTWSDLEGVSPAHLAEALVIRSCVQVIGATPMGAPRAPPADASVLPPASARAPAPGPRPEHGASLAPTPTVALPARPLSPANAEWSDDRWAAPSSRAAPTAVGYDPGAADAQWGDGSSAEFSSAPGIGPTTAVPPPVVGPMPGAAAAQRGDHRWAGFSSAAPPLPIDDRWAGSSSAIPPTPVCSVPGATTPNVHPAAASADAAANAVGDDADASVGPTIVNDSMGIYVPIYWDAETQLLCVIYVESVRVRHNGDHIWPPVHRFVMDVATFEVLSLGEDDQGKVFLSCFGYNPAGVLQKHGLSIFQRPPRPGGDAMLLMSFRSIKVREKGSSAPEGFAAAPGAGPLGESLVKLFRFCLGAYGEAIVPSPMLTSAPGRDGQPATYAVHAAGPPSCRQEFSLADPEAHRRLRTIVANRLRTRTRHVSWLHGGEMSGVGMGTATTTAIGAGQWPQQHPQQLSLTFPPSETGGVAVATTGGGAGAAATGKQRQSVRYWCPARGCGYSTPRRYNLKIHSGKVGATVGEEGSARGGGHCGSGGPMQRHQGYASLDQRHATNHPPRLLLC